MQNMRIIIEKEVDKVKQHFKLALIQVFIKII